jgi:hypothetical protein
MLDVTVKVDLVVWVAVVADVSEIEALETSGICNPLVRVTLRVVLPINESLRDCVDPTKLLFAYETKVLDDGPGGAYVTPTTRNLGLTYPASLVTVPFPPVACSQNLPSVDHSVAEDVEPDGGQPHKVVQPLLSPRGLHEALHPSSNWLMVGTAKLCAMFRLSVNVHAKLVCRMLHVPLSTVDTVMFLVSVPEIVCANERSAKATIMRKIQKQFRVELLLRTTSGLAYIGILLQVKSFACYGNTNVFLDNKLDRF